MELNISFTHRDCTLGIAVWWGPSYLALSFLFFTFDFSWERE